MRISRTIQEMPSMTAETPPYKAAIIEAPQQFGTQKAGMPKPGPGEVRIKLEGSGVCASTIPSWQGREWFHYPMEPGAPGHEGWGIIDEVGEGVKSLAKRERVTGLSYKAYATHDIAKAEHVVKLPDFLDDKPFPGEPLGCVMNIFSRSDIQKGQTVAIVGSGFLGLLLIQLAKAVEATIIAISRRPYSLQMAKEAGADYTIAMKDHYHIIEEIKQLTKGKFCDRVIETTGVEWPLNLAIELTGERGKLIVAGFHQDGMRNVNMQMLNWRGIDMISAHERDPKQYIKGIKAAIEAVRGGSLNPFPYFTHSFSLEETQTAYKFLTERPDSFIKALIIND